MLQLNIHMLECTHIQDVLSLFLFGKLSYIHSGDIQMLRNFCGTRWANLMIVWWISTTKLDWKHVRSPSPKKSQLSGGQTLTRKNLLDKVYNFFATCMPKVRKLLLRQISKVWKLFQTVWELSNYLWDCLETFWTVSRLKLCFDLVRGRSYIT